jgi:hypothetical protein
LRFPKCADSVAGVGCSAAEHRAAGCGRLLSDGERARRSSPTFLVMHLMPPESRRAQQVANTERPLSLPPSLPPLPSSLPPSLPPFLPPVAGVLQRGVRVLCLRHFFAVRFRAKVEYIRQARPDSGLDFQVKVHETPSSTPSSLGSGALSRWFQSV